MNENREYHGNGRCPILQTIKKIILQTHVKRFRTPYPLENSLVLVFDSLQISHPLKYFYPRNLLPKYS